MRSCVCVCVRARVCVFVCLYSFTVKASSVSNDVSPPKTKFQHADKLEKKRYDILILLKDDIYRQDASRPPMILKQTSDKKILKIRSLFLYFESSPWHQHRNLFVLIECSSIAPTMSDELFLLMHWVEPFSQISPLTTSRWVPLRGNTFVLQFCFRSVSEAATGGIL